MMLMMLAQCARGYEGGREGGGRAARARASDRFATLFSRCLRYSPWAPPKLRNIFGSYPEDVILLL